MSAPISVATGFVQSSAGRVLPPDPAYKLIAQDGTDTTFTLRRDGMEFPGLGVLLRETYKTRSQNPIITASMVFVPGVRLDRTADGDRWVMVVDDGQATTEANPATDGGTQDAPRRRGRPPKALSVITGSVTEAQ